VSAESRGLAVIRVNPGIKAHLYSFLTMATHNLFDDALPHAAATKHSVELQTVQTSMYPNSSYLRGLGWQVSLGDVTHSFQIKVSSPLLTCCHSRHVTLPMCLGKLFVMFHHLDTMRRNQRARRAFEERSRGVEQI